MTDTPTQHDISLLSVYMTHWECAYYGHARTAYPNPNGGPVMADVLQLARVGVRRVPAGHEHRHVHGRQRKDHMEDTKTRTQWG